MLYIKAVRKSLQKEKVVRRGRLEKSLEKGARLEKFPARRLSALNFKRDFLPENVEISKK